MKNVVLFSALMFIAMIGFAQPRPNPAPRPDHSGGYNGHGGGYNLGPPMMDQGAFANARDAIKRQPFDDDRVRIAKQVVGANRISSAQARELVALMTFDDSKLDIAKFAYTRVVDPQNYYVVNDAFTFSSTIEDLDAYMNSVVISSNNTWTSSHGGQNGGGHGQGTGPRGGNGHGHGGGNGHGYGQNGYYGGNQGGMTYGGGNGVSYNGGVNTVPVVPVAPPMPSCGMCHNFHAVSMVCDNEYNNIAAAICHQTFESDKMIVAKQAIGCKMLSAGQVLRLMGHFTFESTKLDFAKWAYAHCWDQQNYYVVNDGFTFSSSVRDLDCFIRRG
jgi:hypothetical protein